MVLEVSMPRTPSGRPELGEYADYMAEEIAALPGDDLLSILSAQAEETARVLRTFEGRGDHAYAPGKWTVKQVLGHLIDDERVFGCRGLCVAREEPLALPGFDENLYVRTAGFENRTIEDLLEEYAAVRAASLAFFRGLPEEAWRRFGTVNGYRASVRGLGFQIAAHERHHLRILEARYR
jgi:hypothetical protein